MSRSIESISHQLDPLAAAMIPADQARRIAAIGRAITPQGRVRADRLEGFVEPERLPGIGLEYVGDGAAFLDFPSIPAQTCADMTLTVEGAVAGGDHRVLLAIPFDFPTGLAPMGIVTAADTVTIRLCNATAGAINPPARTWQVSIVR